MGIQILKGVLPCFYLDRTDPAVLLVKKLLWKEILEERGDLFNELFFG